MNINNLIEGISQIDMTIPAAISFGCAVIGAAISAWPLVYISILIDVLVACVAGIKIINWSGEQPT